MSLLLRACVGIAPSQGVEEFRQAQAKEIQKIELDSSS